MRVYNRGINFIKIILKFIFVGDLAAVRVIAVYIIVRCLQGKS